MVALSRCKEVTLTKIASKNIQTKKVGRKRAMRPKQNRAVSPEKMIHPPKRQDVVRQKNTSIQNELILQASQSSSTLLSTFCNEQQSLNIDSSSSTVSPQPIPLNYNADNDKLYFGSIKNISNVPVVTLLSICDKRVSVCYGCSGLLKPLGNLPPPPHDLVVVKDKTRILQR